MLYYDYQQFCGDVQTLSTRCDPFRADTVLGVARGGITLAHALSMALDIRNLQTLRVESYDGDTQRQEVTIFGECDLGDSQRVLVVDDIVDSGKTLFHLMPWLRSKHPQCEFKVAALFTKSSALIQPDFSLHEAHEWIEFFWERDFLKTGSL